MAGWSVTDNRMVRIYKAGTDAIIVGDPIAPQYAAVGSTVEIKYTVKNVGIAEDIFATMYWRDGIDTGYKPYNSFSLGAGQTKQETMVFEMPNKPDFVVYVGVAIWQD